MTYIMRKCNPKISIFLRKCKAKNDKFWENYKTRMSTFNTKGFVFDRDEANAGL